MRDLSVADLGVKLDFQQRHTTKEAEKFYAEVLMKRQRAPSRKKVTKVRETCATHDMQADVSIQSSNRWDRWEKQGS